MMEEVGEVLDLSWYEALITGRSKGMLFSRAEIKSDLGISFSEPEHDINEVKEPDQVDSELEKLKEKLPQIAREMTGFHFMLEAYEAELSKDDENNGISKSLRKGEKVIQQLNSDIIDYEKYVSDHEAMKRENLRLEEEIIQLKLDIAESLGCEDICQHELKVAKSQLNSLRYMKRQNSEKLLKRGKNANQYRSKQEKNMHANPMHEIFAKSKGRYNSMPSLKKVSPLDFEDCPDDKQS